MYSPWRFAGQWIIDQTVRQPEGTTPTPDVAPGRLKGPVMKAETISSLQMTIADANFPSASSFQQSLSARRTPAALAGTASEALSIVERNPRFHLAFVDSHIPPIGGLPLLERLHRVNPALAVIIMSASGTPVAAVEAIKRGPEDYIVKPFDFSTVAHKIARLEELLEYRSGVRVRGLCTGPGHTLEDFVYGSNSICEVLSRAKTASAAGASILLVGQTGVGKDMLARVIHAASPRASGPLFRIDCRSFQHDLLGRDRLGGYPAAHAQDNRRRDTSSQRGRRVASGHPG